MPSLERLHQNFKGNKFVLLGIDIKENKSTVQKYIDKHSLSYDNLLDTDGEVSLIFGVRSTPMKMLIDKEGNLAGAALGYRDWDKDEFKLLIEALMKQ